MSESDDPSTDTDVESTVNRAEQKCKTANKPTVQCLRLPCQDPALILTNKLSPALQPQNYRLYMKSKILLPRTWSRDLEHKYKRITNRPPYFPYDKQIYELATNTDPNRDCPCLHIIPDPNLLQRRVIDWPCGCLSPDTNESNIIMEKLAEVAASRSMKWPPAPTHVLLSPSSSTMLYHVPTRPKPVTRRKRRGSKRLSLTDKKHYRVGDNSASRGR